MRFIRILLPLALLSLVAWLLLSRAPLPEAPPTGPPNILLILADDLGNNDVSSFGDGGLATPNIDALAAGGMRFNRHYAHATCRPSRLALLTGMPASRTGVPPYFRGIPPEYITLPRALQDAGYHTVHIGKWHLGRILPSSQPQEQGFDEWYGFLAAMSTKRGSLKHPGKTYFNPFLQQNGRAPRQAKGHMTELFTRRAINTIERLADSGQPWFINLWYYAPHEPIEPAPDYAERFADTEEGRYLALVAQLDQAIGRLLQTLENRGLRENTLVVFASDNGGLNRARDNNAPFHGVKRSFLEGGLRTPLLLNQPGRIASGTSDEPVFISDLMPTLLEAAGAPIPPRVVGRSLLPLLDGEPIPAVQQYFWEIQMIGHREYGMLDLAGGRLIAPPLRQAWLAQEGRFGSPEPASPEELAWAQSRYADWRTEVRATDPQTETYRRTPGYGAWNLQATVPATVGARIVQPGQFAITRQAEQLAVLVPGHRFTLPLPPPGTVLTLNTYYAWNEFAVKKSKAVVAVYFDEDEAYRQEFPIREEILKDRCRAVEASPQWGEVVIRNDFQESGLVQQYRAAQD